MKQIQSSTESRRGFIGTTTRGMLAVSTSGLFARTVCAAGLGEHYKDLASADWLEAVRVETRIRDAKVFTEGPAADREGNLFFTNVPVAKILKWSPRKKELSVFRENSNEANGLLFEPDGSLLACEGGAGRVTRTNMRTGAIEVLADSFAARPIGAPNDLTRDAAGRIYFTSRFGNTRPKEGNVDSVYRIDPSGKVSRIVHDPATRKPNGIVTSPDDRRLYLIEAHPLAQRPRNIQVFDLRADGSVANQRTLINFYPGRSGDGMCIDEQGNLYVAAGLHRTRKTSETLDTRPGIHVVSPEGKLLAYRETAEDTITNCTFGGEDRRTLYVTCGTYLLSIRTKIPGKRTFG